ncbi:MAG: 2-phospho-L-lactate transferase CofD family protein, partial [Chloroflexota bacterium]
VFVCNVATQPGETDGYSVFDHVKALEQHAGGELFPIVAANDWQEGELLPGLQWVKFDPPLNGSKRLILADVAQRDRPWRHDSTKLANLLIKLIEENLVAL